MEYRSIQHNDLNGIIRLCEAEGWPSFSVDPALTWRALTAPGVTTMVAREGDTVAGFAQMCLMHRCLFIFTEFLSTHGENQHRTNFGSDASQKQIEQFC